ncbi:MAG: glycoside hydrolase family 3 N-terminal domain-containing protein [Bacteroidota bacterium]
MKTPNVKLLLSAIVIAIIGITYQSCTTSNASPADLSAIADDPEMEKRIKEIMTKMDLKDKVGEMTQYTIDMISVGKEYSLKEPHTLDEAKLQDILVDKRVGSILNVGGHAYSREHWHEIMTTIQDYAMNKKASGIPVLFGIDAIHGANYTMGSTLFPQQISLAATWNPDLAKQMGKITAYETRASYIPWTFSPVQDLGRDPRWPRIWETFGEDVYLAQEMGEAIVAGYEGEGEAHLNPKTRVAACLKHFVGYSQPLAGKDRTQAWIPERKMREYFLPPFQAGIDAGAESVMICSGEVNGIPVHADKKMLTDVLRGEMGFKGVAVTDWDDITFLQLRHRVAATYREAIKFAINAGIDMVMVPTDIRFCDELFALAESGEVPMSRIDEAVARILRMKIRLGLWENPVGNPDDYPDFALAASAEASYNTAIEAITLLKNDNNVLPLKEGTKILVTGPTANEMQPLNGGWTRTWQGIWDKWNAEEESLTIREAIEAEFGTGVQYVQGVELAKEVNIAEAIQKARSVDVIVACVGEYPYTEKPGDIRDLNLHEAQYKLIDALAKTGKPVVLLQVGGRPRIITSMVEQADAVLGCFLPGGEGGRAIASILSGAVNPSGKLPITYPSHANSLETYDYKGTDNYLHRGDTIIGYQPLFPFGHGLSYTRFAYSDLTASVLGETVKVSVKITNTGNRDGKETVIVYVRDNVASITPSNRRVRAFDKLELKSGESQTATFEIPVERLGFVGIDNKWIVEPGGFEVFVGDQMAKFEIN